MIPIKALKPKKKGRQKLQSTLAQKHKTKITFTLVPEQNLKLFLLNCTSSFEFLFVGI